MRNESDHRFVGVRCEQPRTIYTLSTIIMSLWTNLILWRKRMKIFQVPALTVASDLSTYFCFVATLSKIILWLSWSNSTYIKATPTPWFITFLFSIHFCNLLLNVLKLNLTSGSHASLRGIGHKVAVKYIM